MVVTNQLRNQHLLWRSGFGPKAEDLSSLSSISQKELVRKTFKDSAKRPEYIDVAKNAIDGVVKGFADAGKIQNLTKEQKQEIRKQAKEGLKNLNGRWMEEMINGDDQLREKLSLFWHGHFSTRIINVYYQQILLGVIRENALGDFKTLLREVSKSAAMLSFLNNQQNRKQHPNENFAREVMELFTLGRGNYTENDIREGARAFTGWGFNVSGEFVFRDQWHDSGEKNFLGKRGNLNGDDVLDILLENKKTAQFITRKLYRYFVNEQVDEQRVLALSEKFYSSGYNIKALMETIFAADWFFDQKNIGNQIKSPVELIVGIRRMLPMELKNPDIQLLLQRVLGQILFYPPNVAGWPGGRNWIDSSTLMFRLRVPQLMVGGDEFNVKPKDDDDQQMGMMEMSEMKKEKGKMAAMNKMMAQNAGATIAWDVYLQNFAQVEKTNMIDTLTKTVLQRDGVDKNLLLNYADISGRDNLVKSVTLALMSTPEYQLC